MKAGQANPTVDHRNSTLINRPSTFMPTGVSGAMGGSMPKPNMKSRPIMV